MRKAFCTARLIWYALLPKSGGGLPVSVTGGVMPVEPGELRGGMERYLDADGELRVLFRNCLAPAAPFVLFRLKRQGFSRCAVRVTAGGLLVEGRR